MKFYVVPLAFLAAQCVSTATAAGTATAPEHAIVNFETHIRPVLRTYCFDCHGANEKPEGGLDLRLRRLIVKGGDSGPAIVPGNRNASLLLQRVLAGEMPPTEKKLPPGQAKVLAAWISAGAPTLHDEPKALGKGLPITEEERAFWAFQPPKRPAIPKFDSEDRVRTSIDALLLSRMRERRLAFSPDADKLTLLR